MFREFVQEINKNAIEAIGPQFKPFDPTKAVAYLEGGVLKIRDGKAPRRQHDAYDLQTVVAFAERFNGDENDPAQTCIWYSRDGVVCILNDDPADDQSRLDVVSLGLTKSKQVDVLQAWNDKQPLLSQREVMYTLRTTFADCAEKHPNLQKQFAKIDWEAGAKTSAELGRGKSSIGKTVKAEAGGLDDLPEQVTLTVPAFTEYFARKPFDVRCALEIHESEQKFQLFPLPGELEKLYASAEAEVCSMIMALVGEQNIPVYYGNP